MISLTLAIKKYRAFESSARVLGLWLPMTKVLPCKSSALGSTCIYAGT